MEQVVGEFIGIDKAEPADNGHVEVSFPQGVKEDPRFLGRYLHIDAHFLQLLLDDLRRIHLVGKIGTRLQRQLEVFLAGFLQELFGLGHIPPGIQGEISMSPVIGRNVASLQHRRPVQFHNLVDRFPIHRVGDRLSHFYVIQRRTLGVEADVLPKGSRHGHDLDGGDRLQHPGFLGGNVQDHVHLLIAQGRQPRRLVGDGAKDDFIQVGLIGAVVPGKLFQPQILILFPLLQLKGAAARVGSVQAAVMVLHRLSVHDGVHRISQIGQEGSHRLFQPKNHRMGVGGLDLVHGGKMVLANTQIDDALDGILDILRSQFPAGPMKPNPFSKGEGVGFPVLRHLHLFRQFPFHFPVFLRISHQTAVHILNQVHRGGIRRLVGIQGFSVGLQSDADRAARFGRPILPTRIHFPARAGTACPHQQGRDQHNPPNPPHVTPPLIKMRAKEIDNYVYSVPFWPSAPS